MKLKNIATLALLALFAVSGLNAQSLSPSTKTYWDKGTLVVETPARPEGQQHVVGLKAPKLKTVRVAFVGLGMRGPGAVTRFTHIPGVEVVALCDTNEEKLIQYPAGKTTTEYDILSSVNTIEKYAFYKALTLKKIKI